MLADDQAVEDVVFGPDGLLQAMPKSSIHVSMSTISVALSKGLATAHEGAKSGIDPKQYLEIVNWRPVPISRVRKLWKFCRKRLR
jgi:hypothetical protein